MYRLEGPVHTWGLGGGRRFLSVVVPYRTARDVFVADLYDAKKGSGEQRREIDSHVRAIRRDMLAPGGEYTPTAVAAGLRGRHLDGLVVEGGVGRLDVSPETPLPLTDGQQRFAALRQIVEAAEKAGDADLLEAALSAPIEVTVHVDGDTQRDFLNLQKGRPVDGAHMLSLKVQQRLVPQKDYADQKLAQDVAKVLNASPESPLNKMVRFDTRGYGPLPVTTLCAKGASELAVSLVGLARVGHAAGIKDPRRLAFLLVSAVEALKARHPHLVPEAEEGGNMPLALPPNGTKGAATMLVGLAVCLAYRLKTRGTSLPDDDDLARLAAAAASTFKHPVKGNFSSQFKRALMREFAAEFFHGLKLERHQGVPVELLRILAPSAFGCSPPKAPARKKPAAKRPAKKSRARAGAERDGERLRKDLRRLLDGGGGGPEVQQVREDVGAGAEPPDRPVLPEGETGEGGVGRGPEGRQDEGPVSELPQAAEAKATGGEVRFPSDAVPTMLIPGTSHLSRKVVDKLDKLHAVDGGDNVLVLDGTNAVSVGPGETLRVSHTVVVGDGIKVTEGTAEALPPAEKYPWDEES
jgi:hypothetical protein